MAGLVEPDLLKSDYTCYDADCLNPNQSNK